MIRVMIVDDQEIIRAGLRTILDAHPSLTVVAQEADGFAALRRLDETEVDVVLLDLRMPGIDGVEVVRRIRNERSLDDLKILMLTTFDQDENVLNAVRAGANGFFSKGASPTELTDGILQIAEGHRALSPVAVTALVDHVREDRALPADPEMAEQFSRLTPRELEIVTAVVEGLDNAEIARRLFLSPYTVKTHANRAMMKVGARDRGQLVSFAVRAGILP
jgi:DNA-binding NarL/FixJ family response regulator